jgi:hypothetical protein
VLVPEAAVHQDGGLVARKDDIWRAGQVRSVKAKAQAHRVKGLSNCQFWSRVFLCDRAHDP